MPRLVVHALRAALLAVVLVSATLNVALAQQGHGFAPKSSPVAVTGGWEVVEKRELDIDGELVALSPDGQWIAGIGDDFVFCVWEVETLDAMCDEEREPIEPISITWAPDSTAVAYSLDALKQLYDSDIFVFELADGVSTNLTEDGFRDRLPVTTEPDVDTLPVDIFPTWSADSTTLTFARSDWILEEPTTELMAVSREGGEPARLQVVSESDSFAVASPMSMLEDGTLVYSLWLRNPRDEANGVWVLRPDGEMEQVMAGNDQSDFPFPRILDVANDETGPVVSGYSWRRIGMLDNAGPYAFQLNLADGSVTPGIFDIQAGTYSYGERFGPDGTSTVSVVVRNDEPWIEVTGPDGTISDMGTRVTSMWLIERGVDWAENDTLLVPTGRSGGRLVTIAPVDAG